MSKNPEFVSIVHAAMGAAPETMQRARAKASGGLVKQP